MDYSSLHQIIIDLCEQQPNPQQEGVLARLSIELAKTHLQILERQGRHIRETHQYHEFESMAADCVADLFTHDSQGRLIYFSRVMKPMIDKNCSTFELLIRLRKLVTNRVNQYLTYIFRQRDPDGAKLLRNIRILAARHPQLQIDRSICSALLIYSPDANAEDSVYKPSLDSIERAARERWKSSMNLEQMVLNLLHHLANGKHRIGILILDLVRLLKMYRSAFAYSTIDVSHSESAREYLDIFETVLYDMAVLIQKSYVDKQKLTLHQGLALFAALKDYIRSLVESEDPEKNYFYVKRQWSDLTEKDYETRVRTIYEYLLRQMRKKIAAQAHIIF